MMTVVFPDDISLGFAEQEQLNHGNVAFTVQWFQAVHWALF